MHRRVPFFPDRLVSFHAHPCEGTREISTGIIDLITYYHDPKVSYRNQSDYIIVFELLGC
jgi:hypothetical protein